MYFMPSSCFSGRTAKSDLPTDLVDEDPNIRYQIPWSPLMNRTTLSGKTQPEFLVPVRSFVVTLIHIGLVFLLALPAVLVPARAYAQEFRATISCTVSDPTGAVVPGTSVTATEVTTGSVSKTTADAAGQYVIPFLAPGTYRI